jgi:tetratricopeptide (TPR) repeat protein
MRNVANSFATGEYVMWMDAGDEATKLDLIKEKLLTCRPDHIGLQTIFGSQIYWRARVVAREFALWEDDVHEILNITGLYGVSIPDASVLHTQQVKIGREDSIPRNIRLLRQMIEREGKQHPRYPRWVYYLARELATMEQFDEAIKWYLEGIPINSFVEEVGHSYLALCKIYFRKGKYAEVKKYGLQLVATCPDWREGYYLVGDAYFWMADYQTALAWYLHANAVPLKPRTLWINLEIYQWLTFCQLSYTYERLGDIAAALEYCRKEQPLVPENHVNRVIKRLAALEAKIKEIK